MTKINSLTTCKGEKATLRDLLFPVFNDGAVSLVEYDVDVVILLSPIKRKTFLFKIPIYD